MKSPNPAEMPVDELPTTTSRIKHVNGVEGVWSFLTIVTGAAALLLAGVGELANSAWMKSGAGAVYDVFVVVFALWAGMNIVMALMNHWIVTTTSVRNEWAASLMNEVNRAAEGGEFINTETLRTSPEGNVAASLLSDFLSSRKPKPRNS